MQFDLTDFSLFRHVVEAGSITHGAERAHLALAAASTRIRNMEKSLGAPLLLRSRQGVTPTPAGRTLLQHARAMLAQAERLREDLGAYTGGLDRPDPDSLQHQCADRVPARGAERVSRRPPAGQRSIWRSGSQRRDRRPDRRGRRRYRHRGRARSIRARLETYPFRSDRFVLVVPRGHPARRQARALRFAEVLDARFRRPRPGERAPALSRRQGEPHRQADPPASAAAQLRCASAAWWKAGVGLGIVPETTARRAAKTMALCHRRSGGSLGRARPHHLHPLPEGPPALRARARGASAGVRRSFEFRLLARASTADLSLGRGGRQGRATCA